MKVYSVNRAKKWLNSFTDYEKTTSYFYTADYFNLNRIKWILKKLGQPQDKFKSIHIAGTKGKGSTAYILASILKEAKFQVGLYTSPHIVSETERIQINGEKITYQEIAELVSIIAPVVTDLTKKTKYGIPTFFEIYTAIAFLYFARKKIDIGVIEVGMGGRLDATNVINPVVSIITTIGYDHTKELGNSLTSIAQEKAGIIKENSIVISASQYSSVDRVIQKQCKIKNAKYFVLASCSGKAKLCRNTFYFKKLISDINGNTFNFYTSTSLRGCVGATLVARQLSNFVVEKYYLPLLGEHQIINTSLAIAAIKSLPLQIPENAIRQGLKNIELSGRLEIVSKKPLIILDGAHNVESARVLKECIKKTFKTNKIFLIIAMSSNKDIKGFGNILCPVASKIILTRFNAQRSANPNKIKEILKKFTRKIVVASDLKSAIEKAYNMLSCNDLLCVTGSFYIIGEAKKTLKFLPPLLKGD